MKYQSSLGVLPPPLGVAAAAADDAADDAAVALALGVKAYVAVGGGGGLAIAAFGNRAALAATLDAACVPPLVSARPAS